MGARLLRVVSLAFAWVARQNNDLLLPGFNERRYFKTPQEEKKESQNKRSMLSFMRNSQTYYTVIISLTFPGMRTADTLAFGNNSVIDVEESEDRWF